MPQRTYRRRIGTVNYQANQLVREQLYVSGKVRKLFLELSGVLTVSANSGTAINRSPGSLVPSLQVLADREIVLKQGRWNDWRDRMYMHYKLPADTAAAVGAGANSFGGQIMIPFITPMGARPVDTVLNMDMFQRLDIEVQWGDEDSLIFGGTKSFTTDPTIDIIAEISRFDPDPNGFYIERAFDSDALGTSANTDLQLELIVGPRINYHHVLLVAEDDEADVGRNLVATALNSIRIQQTGAGELSNPFGIVSGVEQQFYFDQDFATVDGVQTGLYPIPFQAEFDGRKSFNLATEGLDDLRVIVDHAGFTTDGYIRIVNGTVEPLRL